MAQKPSLLGLYEQANIGDGSGAASLWTHPLDRRLTSTTFDYWLHLARIAEETHLDLFFFGDVLGHLRRLQILGGDGDFLGRRAAGAMTAHAYSFPCGGDSQSRFRCHHLDLL